MEDSDPKYYEALKKDFDSENKLMIHISELNIVKSAHEKDLQTIEVLKKHFAFHRGLTFSAKSLAIKTAQICSSLEHLIGAYEPIQSMGYCLEAIHGGISNLQGYTDALNETYKNTFRIMTQTENSDDYHIMSLNSNQLEDVVGRMMDNLDERLAQ